MSDDLEPDAAELLQFAPMVGLNALSGDELRDVEARVAAAPADFRELFDKQVRATREAMAAISVTTATPPPPALRDRVLAAARADAGLTGPPGFDALPQGLPDGDQDGDEAGGSTPPGPAEDEAAEPAATTGADSRRRRWTYLAAAAVIAIAIGAAGWVIGLSSSDPAPGPPLASPAEQVFSASDLRSTGGAVATGSATVYLAKSADTGVLVMHSVPPPKPGTVYQMWLIGPDGPRSAGTMTDKDVEPVTTAVLSGINSASALAFTVEPPGGSAQPTTTPVAQLSLL
ncbi:anti-sigma factor [Gordonia sp. zg691]|uniref:anti-sigma factor n=1 Tax=Gordonia jinghuaiqii TaxID=2758710 RepID=UPI0016628B51|nr:anti-sigma factor [Gordonia jinghuaiqii]MBD0862946.1 anti-sigma factor [Gordonia jinghuaiqii]